MDPTLALDEDQLLIARLMQEEEDLLRAQELQNDYYAGNRPPTATNRVPREDPMEAAGYRAPDEARFDRLISDSRNDLFADDWEMNEHIGGGMQPPRRGGPSHANAREDDDEYQRAIIESMKNAQVVTEDELLARAMEESIRAAN